MRDEEFQANETAFILDAHEKQMESKNLERSLYFRMHKEMSPQLMAVIIELRDSAQSHEEFVAMIHEFIEAYTQFTASTISAVSALLGGKGDDRAKSRQSIAEIMYKGIEFYCKENLEKEKATPNVMDGDGV